MDEIYRRILGHFDKGDREVLGQEEIMFVQMMLDEMTDCSMGEASSSRPRKSAKPKHTRDFSRADLVKDILEGHPERSYDYFRLDAVCVNKLNDELRERGSLTAMRNTSTLEQVCQFLYIITHSLSNRHGTETFQHSGETISRYFHAVLEAVIGMLSDYVKLPPEGNDICHPHIKDDRKYYPFFKDALGAIDGTYIPACVKLTKQNRYRCRKGYPAQNVMGVVSFDHTFLFVAAGAEGSAADMRVLKACMEIKKFSVPHGKYYLVDSGYANTDSFLAPYRRNRYHITEYQRTRTRDYKDAKDKYNHRHSQLRNCVEKAWGILKKRFKILRSVLPYSYETQVKIVLACCVLHNFVARHNKQDKYFNMSLERLGIRDFDLNEELPEDHAELVGRDETARGEALRNRIATELWQCRF